MAARSENRESTTPRTTIVSAQKASTGHILILHAIETVTLCLSVTIWMDPRLIPVPALTNIRGIHRPRHASSAVMGTLMMV